MSERISSGNSSNGLLALKGVNIRSIGFNHSRNRGYHNQAQFNPLQIQPKSLTKFGTNTQKLMRITYSSRKNSKLQIAMDQNKCLDKQKQRDKEKQVQKFPKINENLLQKHEKTEQNYTLKHSAQINHQNLINKQIVALRKKSQMYSQQQLKKVNIYKVKKCTCGDCQQCFKDFTYFLQIFSHDQSVPDITAKSWCIWKKNKNNNKFMYYYGKRIHKVRQIASLTKIITSMVAMDYLSRFQYDPDKITYEIRKPSIMVGGTSAGLQIGQIYTVTQLFYALMLPSGNDAAIAISQVIGLLHNIKMRNKPLDPYKDRWYSQFLNNPNKSYSYHFISMMNQKCRKLGLLDTSFCNSHGNDAYDQLKNVSTCNQIAKISSQYMLKYPFLKQVVHTKAYNVPRYQKIWQNTNKLLQDGFEGIKTGITDTAGPCLAAYYKDLVVVVLNSKTMNQRWIQVKKLVRWIVRKGL